MTEKNSSILSPEYLNFKNEITARIRSAQYEALKAVNNELIALYWDVGKRITEQQTALGWGKSVVENLSRDIQKEFPGIQGFGVRNMWDMARFYAEYQSNEILQPLVAEISWSKHIVILTKCLVKALIVALTIKKCSCNRSSTYCCNRSESLTNLVHVNQSFQFLSVFHGISVAYFLNTLNVVEV